MTKVFVAGGAIPLPRYPVLRMNEMPGVEVHRARSLPLSTEKGA